MQIFFKVHLSLQIPFQLECCMICTTGETDMWTEIRVLMSCRHYADEWYKIRLFCGL